jgi:hypothetical protein
MYDNDRPRRDADMKQTVDDQANLRNPLSSDADVTGKPVGVYDRPNRTGATIWGTLAVLIVLALVAYLLFAFVL